MHPGDLVTCHSVNVSRDSRGVECVWVRSDVDSVPADNVEDRPFQVPVGQAGVLLSLRKKSRWSTFVWAQVLFPQGIGYISNMWLRRVS